MKEYFLQICSINILLRTNEPRGLPIKNFLTNHAASPDVIIDLSWGETGKLIINLDGQQFTINTDVCSGIVSLSSKSRPLHFQLTGYPAASSTVMSSILYLLGHVYDFSVIHASGIANPSGEGIIFCGKSTAGKTTSVRTRPKEFLTLSDETCIISTDKGDAITVNATPVSSAPQEIPCGEALSAPLAKIIFIGERGAPFIERVSAPVAAKLLTPSLWLPRWNQQNALNKIAAMTALPCYRMVTNHPDQVWPLILENT